MVRILGVEWAPLNTPLRRRQQTAGVLLHVLANSGMILVSVIGFFWMLLSGQVHLVYLVCVYSLWMWWDWDSPYNGIAHLLFAERFDEAMHLATFAICAVTGGTVNISHSTITRPANFPMTMYVNNYLFLMHPHGVWGAPSYHFLSNGSGLLDRFPKINFHVCTLVFKFWVPLHREWLMLHGIINCSKRSLHNVLGGSRRGQAAVLVVGGASEALDAHSGEHVLTLKDRKGFAKVALETGAHLVPVFAFGENDIYRLAWNKEGTFVRWFQTLVKNTLGFSPIICIGRGVFNYNIGFLPHRRPLNTVIGAPIPVEKIEHPTQEQIDQVHAHYIEKLTELYEEHKTKYGVTADNYLILK